jgi:hypothetical protein
VFGPGGGHTAAQPAVDVKSLHAKIGELTLAPLGHQQAAQHPRAGKGKLQMQPVETPHDGKVGFRHRQRQVVDAAAADTQNFSLLGDRQIVRAVARSDADT